MDITNNIEIETKEQYHARCEERKRLAAERARRQSRQRALLAGGVALIFVAVIGSIIGIRSLVAAARATGAETEVVSEVTGEEAGSAVAEAEAAEAVGFLETGAAEAAESGVEAPSQTNTEITDDSVPTDQGLTSEVSEEYLSEGAETAAGTAPQASTGDQATPAATGTLPSGEAASSYTPLHPTLSDSLLPIPEEVISEHAVLISLSDEKIVADLGKTDRISPASMTKVLTLLTAVENLPDTWETDTFTMTIDITDYSFVNDCSNVGFEVGEEIPIKDLLYGTILPSGADAALGLANYIAGSHEAFVDLMNAKLEALGISGTTHFTNCVGLYHEDHYTTCLDMAIIMKAAMDNALCREVLSCHVYTTSPTTPHPDGLILSNWFLRRIEDKDCGGFVVGAKTGFVVQSKCCAVSLAQAPDGSEYILVTAGSTSSWRAIYDQVAIYKACFSPQESKTQ